MNGETKYTVAVRALPRPDIFAHPTRRKVEMTVYISYGIFEIRGVLDVVTIPHKVQQCIVFVEPHDHLWLILEIGSQQTRNMIRYMLVKDIGPGEYAVVV